MPGLQIIDRTFLALRSDRVHVDDITWYACSVRVKLGEPYRTILGHLRHEIGHYFQNVLITDETTWARCRDLFGDERESYRDAIDRHYSVGAPADWQSAFISEYATMHAWEDFAETFAHYLHIVGTLQTSAAIGIRLEAGASTLRDTDVVPRDDYRDEPIGRVLADWAAMSQGFNRVNRSMGFGDLYRSRSARPCSASSASSTSSSPAHP